MANAHKRKWYAVYIKGDDELYYLISALSIRGIHIYLRNKLRKYIVIQAKEFHFAKVFSGELYDLPRTDALAPNHWSMQNDDVIYNVVIL